MKLKHLATLTMLPACLAALNATAQPFSSGSDGRDGNLNVTTNTTLQAPPDGIFRFGSITVATNTTLTFARNSLNTPIYLLATNDILVVGTINLNGVSGAVNGDALYALPGPGGFSGGATPVGSAEAAGTGPGEGRRSATDGSMSYGGSFGSGGGYNAKGQPSYDRFATNTYGNKLLIPLVGGSGGGGCPGGASGGGGGGAILLASDTRVTVTGAIRARGGNGVFVATATASGAGAGGAIRIVAPLVAGAGQLDVSGGTNSFYTISPYTYPWTWGGGGRVRVDCTSQIPAFTIPNYGYRYTSPVYSYGRSMFVFPPTSKGLFFLSAAGQEILPGTDNAVRITLPAGSPTNQMVRLCGYGFNGSVPVQVVATPDVGPVFSTNITMIFPATGTANYVTNDVTVNILNLHPTQLNAYARYGVMP